MKLPLYCMQCLQVHMGGPNSDQPPDLGPHLAVLQNDGLYRFTCRAGHEMAVLLQAEKFEMLFELGMNAMLDGYPRDAIGSFAASLERFYEFYIQVIASHRSIDKQAFDASWKKIAKQSERQLGAFILMYTMETNRTPSLLTSSQIEFRNEVVHKGRIPTKEETIEFGKTVLDLISPVMHELKTRHAEALQKVLLEHSMSVRMQSEKRERVATMAYPTIIGIIRAATEPDRTVEEWLIFLSNRRSHGF